MHFDMLELKPQQLYQYILSSFPSMAAGRAGQRRAGGPMSPWTQILQKRYKLSLSCAQKLSLTTITHTQGGFWSLTYCTFRCSGFAHFIFAKICLFCPEIIGMDNYYLNLRCMSKRVVSCYEGLNQVR